MLFLQRLLGISHYEYNPMFHVAPGRGIDTPGLSLGLCLLIWSCAGSAPQILSESEQFSTYPH